MQTPQVSNPANLMTSQPTTARQADTGSSGAPFGQVLSREMAGRNASEGSRPQARETGNAAPSRQPTRNDSKAADTKGAKDTKRTGGQGESADADGATVDPALQAPEDMLALVANLSQIVTQPGEAPEASVEQQMATDPAATLIPVATVSASVSALSVTAPVDVTQSGTHVVPETVMTGDTSLTAGLRTSARVLPDTAPHSETPQLTTAELEAKGRDLLSGAPTATAAAIQTATAPAQDFSSAVKDSVSALNASTATVMTPVQQAAVNAAQSMGNNAERLTPRVGTPAWDQALGQKVVWMVAGEQQSASLTLNPPDLGPLQVVLNVSNSQASATFTAAQPEVRQALEAALPKLREMLGEAGIQLGQASVNSGAPNQQGAFDQSAADASSRGQGHADHRDAGADTESPRVSRVRPATSGLGMVDTFA
ncbi:MAG TPA: flagellar hook-length control protein FliK [Noviherbaspirillum sp.]